MLNEKYAKFFVLKCLNKKQGIEKQDLEVKIVTRKWSALEAYSLKFIYNFIIQVDDASVAEELFREQAGSANSARNDKTSDRWGDIYEDMPLRRKMALYDYDPRELSPNVDSEVELSFRTGDVIIIYGDMDDDGFFMGELNGSRGLVPSNFLADIPNGVDSKTMLRQVLASGPRVLGQQRPVVSSARWQSWILILMYSGYTCFTQPCHNSSFKVFYCLETI